MKEIFFTLSLLIHEKMFHPQMGCEKVQNASDDPKVSMERNLVSAGHVTSFIFTVDFRYNDFIAWFR